MTYTEQELREDDAALACYLADKAGKILLGLQVAGEFEGKELGKQGDAQANIMLMEEIAQYRPDDGVLSEETKDTPARLKKSRVWIVDPLDGTREYGEKRTDWAVHVALAVDEKATVGAVALPGLDLVLSSDQTGPLPAENNPPRMLVSRTRPAREAVEVAEKIGAELYPMGSAGAKAMAVVRGEADIYLHSGGQYEWDNCAPVAVAQAYGLHCSRIDGSELVYNQENVYLPDLLICRKEVAADMLRHIAELPPVVEA